MIIRGKSFKAGLLAGAGILLVPLFGARPATAATPTVATCGKAVEGEIVKVQGAIMKALEVCLDGYHADLLKPESPQFTKASAKCELGLSKAIGIGNASTMDKEFIKLNSFVGKSCDDVSLALLGHLTPTTFGQVWSRAVVMAALNSAYNEELGANQDMVAGLGNLGGLFGSPAGGCPDCKTLTTPPCIEHACAYLSGSGTGFSIHSESGINIPLAGGLQALPGVSTFNLCQYKGPGGQPVNPDKDYLVLGGSASKGIKPALVPGIGHACVTGLGAEGYINCGGSDPGINYHSCQDSNVAAAAGDSTQAGAAGGCQAAITPTVCGIPTHTDEVNGGVNGGACIHLDKTAAASGVGFVNNTSAINVCQFGQEGADGVACTGDDTNAPTQPGTNGLTTGSADITVLNLGVPPGSGTADNGPVNGSNFNCGNIQTSNLSGGAIAGAFPGVANLAATSTVLGDQATTFIISCE